MYVFLDLELVMFSDWKKIVFGGIWFVRCLLGPLKYNIHHILKRIYGRNEMVSSLLFLQIVLK